MDTDRSHAPLGADDPPPVRVTNPGGRSSFLLIGDHAGRAIPAVLGTLGVGKDDLARHIACDIGVSGLGRHLAKALDCGFIEQVYSRLVIDCNRPDGHPEAFVTESDGTAIPGNMALDDGERDARRQAIAMPYQAAIAAELIRRDGQGVSTILVSLHSFTPVMAGAVRPWDIGVLHDAGDVGFALSLIERLREVEGVIVGDNAPYRMDDTDYTVPLHAYPAHRPYAELEIRQDHLADDSGQRLWASRLADMFRKVMQHG